MNETLSTVRHAIIEARVGKAAIALGLGAALLSACGGSETAPSPTPSPVEIEATPEQCAIFGLENLSFDDDGCIIGPAN